MKILYEISKLDIPVAIFFPLKTSIVPKYLHKKKPNMVVSGKKRDIAILRSIGYEESDIIVLFLVQGIILGLSGAILS